MTTPLFAAKLKNELRDEAADAAAAAAVPFVEEAQAWAESATAPGGAGTKSAKTWAGEAAASAVLADTAADRSEAARDVAIAAGVQYPTEAAAVAAIADGAFASYLDAAGNPVWGQRTGSTMTPLPGPWIGSDKVEGLPVLATDRGLKGDGVTNDQAAMNALLADTSAKVIRFPAGIYRCTLANGLSNRTFIFDEGAVIDGVVHLATGGGPDVDGGGPSDPIEWVDNVNVIGTVTSTVRVGTYYCRGVHIPKIRITEINAAYLNQTAEGGSKGVHIYVGSKNVFVGEIEVESATAGTYAIGIDIANAARNTGVYRPENVEIGRAVVTNCSQSVLVTISTKSLKIGTLISDSFDTFVGAVLSGDEDLRIDKIKIAGSPSTANRDGIYIQNGISASFGEAEISGSTQIGFRTLNCARVDADVIRSSGNSLDQVRIESPGTIGRIETSDGGTGVGVLLQGNANGIKIGSINENGGGGITVVSDDVVINRIVSNTALATGKFGLFLSGADRFVNDYLLVDSNTQGLRMVNVTDPTFGDMFIRNNTNGIVGSNVTGLSYRMVAYSGNTTDTNITLNTVSGFKGALVRRSVASLGDASATLTAGVNPVTQICAVPLTADRTITLSTAGAQNGDKFRIVRTSASTGSFNLAVAGIVALGTRNLATGQWMELEFLSGWQMTARGALT